MYVSALNKPKSVDKPKKISTNLFVNLKRRGLHTMRVKTNVIRPSGKTSSKESAGEGSNGMSALTL